MTPSEKEIANSLLIDDTDSSAEELRQKSNLGKSIAEQILDNSFMVTPKKSNGL